MGQQNAGASGIEAVLDPSPPPFPPDFSVDTDAVMVTPPCGAAEADRDAVGEVPDVQPYLLRHVIDAGTSLASGAENTRATSALPRSTLNFD